MKCFYHSADLDGHCSGALVKMAYPDCELIGINYGDMFPWSRLPEDADLVFMVDFSLQPFDKMVKLQRLSGTRLIWIDHHKSAIEELDAWNESHPACLTVGGIRRIGLGACALVWEWLKGDGHFYVEDFQMVSEEQRLPTFIKLLAEYDVWNHSDPRTLAFQYGMRLYDTIPERNMEFWRSLFDAEQVQHIVERGGTVLQYQKSENEKYMAACGFDTTLDGLRCVAINKMLTNSQVFDSAWDPYKYDAMLTFGFRKGSWTVSLYSDKDEVDVSVIAKNRGGGGHKGAAGFQCDTLPFDLT